MPKRANGEIPLRERDIQMAKTSIKDFETAWSDCNDVQDTNETQLDEIHEFTVQATGKAISALTKASFTIDSLLNSDQSGTQKTQNYLQAEKERLYQASKDFTTMQLGSYKETREALDRLVSTLKFRSLGMSLDEAVERTMPITRMVSTTKEPDDDLTT